jgi:hypothetical protein
MVLRMPIREPATALLAIFLVLCTAFGASAEAAPATNRTSAEGALLKALVRSKELWGTIDICNPKDQPDTVGIRGSMPGDGRAHDGLFMRFRLQYQDAKTKQWFDLPLPGPPKPPKFIRVGAGASVRQGGRSFQLQPQAGKPAFMLRGFVEFQWRRAGRVIQAATRSTTARHRSGAGADPAGFTSAGCLIG